MYTLSVKMTVLKSNLTSLKYLKGFLSQKQLPQKLSIQNKIPFIITDKEINKASTDFKFKEKYEFMSIYSEVLKDIKIDFTDFIYRNDLEKINNHMLDIIEYNTKGGKYIRAYMLLSMYKLMEDPKKLTSEKMALAHILSWCSEFIHGGLCFIDDFFDKSSTRRGQLCWYRHNAVDLNVVNDFYLVHCMIDVILEKHFLQHPSYQLIQNLFYQIKWVTYMGECLDLRSVNQKGPKLNLFTMERFRAIAASKTGFYLFFSPLSLGMNLANCLEQNLHGKVKDVAVDIGVLYQAQDDFIDCFGNPEVTGKQGSDIKEGKCSWLVVKALEKANPKQKQILKQFYGKKDKESLNTVCDLYNELNLSTEFLEYEKQEMARIREKINRLPDKLPKGFFNNILKLIFNRNA